MHQKRNATLIGLAVVLLVCLVLYIPAKRGDDGRLPNSVPRSAGLASTTPNSPPTKAVTAATVSREAETQQQSRFVAAFATPISFFGKVVDQYGTAVPSADIKISANDKALGGKPSEYVLKSDIDGFFSISSIKGLTLAVEVSKPGYQVVPPADGKVTSSGIFEYGLSSSRGRHHPKKETPVLFTLRKPGQVEPLHRVGERNFRIQRDGAPLTISLDQSGQHNVVLRCWNNDLRRAAGERQYDWRFEAEVLNGGLVPYTGLNTEAPVDGYVPKDLVEMPSSLPPQEWRGFVERTYFIRFDDQTFARAKLEVRAGGDHFVVWESVFNPRAGSRNLESNTAESSSPP